MTIKVKRIEIVLEPEEKFFKRAAKVYSDLDKKEFPKRPQQHLSLESLDLLRQVLTKKRLELLHTIKHDRPASIYELAKLTNRDLKNIRDDLVKLEEFGLIETIKEKGHPRDAIVPVVKFDKLQVAIEI